MKIAVYPGSFDPITNGHIDVIQRALKLFDKVIIAVGDNPQKKPMFTQEERVDMIAEVIKEMGNVEAGKFKGLLLDYVREKKASIVIRGLRAISDFEFEFQRALLNRKLDDSIETVFIMTKENYVFLNSSIVREMAMFDVPLKCFVPEHVEKKLKEKVK